MNRAIAAGHMDLGVVATPCQATAVAQMRMNPLQRSPFQDPIALVIGLFCTWALDFRKFEAFLAERIPLKDIVKIDIPPPPASVLEVYLGADEKRVFSLEEIRPLVPDACAYCPDMTSEFADVSVGVLEGSPDWNTLLVRSDRGEEIVREAVRQEYLIIDDMPGENREHLEWAAGNKKARALRRCTETGRLNGEAGTACLRLTGEVSERILEHGINGKESPCHI
jgi:coenzyme F420 hydrogenase subunit beta